VDSALRFCVFARQVRHARALHGERLLQRHPGSVVAHETVRALPQRRVREIWFPLDDGRLNAYAFRQRHQRLVDIRLRCARFERRSRRWRRGTSTTLSERRR
jgi:hypothetical protein